MCDYKALSVMMTKIKRHSPGLKLQKETNNNKIKTSIRILISFFFSSNSHLKKKFKNMSIFDIDMKLCSDFFKANWSKMSETK